MENSCEVNYKTANQKLNGDVTFVLRCFQRPEMEFRHSLTKKIANNFETVGITDETRTDS
jgi:hypothetical protein